MTTFEGILAQQGVLMYTNTGDSMMPLLRQHRDVLIIRPKPEGRLSRLDVHLWCDLYLLRAPIIFLRGKIRKLINNE